MKLRIALFFALAVSLTPAFAQGHSHTAGVRQHGSSMHDRAPHARIHESQPHH